MYFISKKCWWVIGHNLNPARLEINKKAQGSFYQKLQGCYCRASRRRVGQESCGCEHAAGC